MLDFLICLGIGIIAALFIVGMMISKLKTVHKKQNAADYQKNDSFRLEVSRDSYLYKEVKKTPLQKK